MTALVAPKLSGLRSEWERESVGSSSAGEVLRKYHAPSDWGNPSNNYAWFDGTMRLRRLFAVFPNGRTADLAIKARGAWRIKFGKAAS